jgi:hypothetical protein
MEGRARAERGAPPQRGPVRKRRRTAGVSAGGDPGPDAAADSFAWGTGQLCLSLDSGTEPDQAACGLLVSAMAELCRGVSLHQCADGPRKRLRVLARMALQACVNRRALNCEVYQNGMCFARPCDAVGGPTREMMRAACRVRYSVEPGGACVMRNSAHACGCVECGFSVSVTVYDSQTLSASWRAVVCPGHALYVHAIHTVYCAPLIVYHSIRSMVALDPVDAARKDPPAVVCEFVARFAATLEWAWAATDPSTGLWKRNGRRCI